MGKTTWRRSCLGVGCRTCQLGFEPLGPWICQDTDGSQHETCRQWKHGRCGRRNLGLSPAIFIGKILINHWVSGFIFSLPSFMALCEDILRRQCKLCLGSTGPSLPTLQPVQFSAPGAGWFFHAWSGQWTLRCFAQQLAINQWVLN